MPVVDDLLTWNSGGRQGPAPDGAAARRGSSSIPGAVFFIARPDAGAAAGIELLVARLRREHGSTGKAIAPDLLHITLLHLGNFPGLPPEMAEAACRVAATVGMPPFKVLFDRTARFSGGQGSNRPLVLVGDDGVAGVMLLQRALGTALRRSGVPYVGVPRRPHVTMLYGREPIPDLVLDAPISWTVRDFALVHSLYGQSIHRPLGEWPLQG